MKKENNIIETTSKMIYIGGVYDTKASLTFHENWTTLKISDDGNVIFFSKHQIDILKKFLNEYVNE